MIQREDGLLITSSFGGFHDLLPDITNMTELFSRRDNEIFRIFLIIFLVIFLPLTMDIW